MIDLSFRPGKVLRLSEFINPEDGKSVILEADQGLMLGPVTGLVELDETVKNSKSEVDAIVLSPGQAGRLIQHFRGRKAPALIVRADWANVFRDETFVLPAEKVRHVTVVSASEALAFGASGIMAFFIVGYEDDEDEAQNMNTLASLARESDRLGVPLLVEALPFGARVTKTNYTDCVDLAMRMSIEAGADAVAVPYTGDIGSFRKIVDAAKVPVFTLDVGNTTKGPVEIATEALKAGASGIVTGTKIFQTAEPFKILKTINGIVHERTKKSS